MRFLVTMSMPSYSGNLVHQMQVEHAASKSLDDFVGALTNNDFVIVEEFYKNPMSDDYNSRGFVAINHRYVGKIKTFLNIARDNGPQRRD
mgnify:FL=1|jgi:hypothetical protein